jgi:glucosylceramidase
MKTMSILSIATALLLSTASCSNSASIDDSPRPAGQGSETTPTGDVATIYTTTGSGAQLLNMSKAEVFTGNNMAPSTIILDPAQQYQTMDGFGFAITYSTCYNLLKMSAEDRAAFLKQTYSETEGYGVSYARISIGCNDFSSTEYSLCYEPGLENFRLYSDETQYVIPVLKEILAINPNVKIIAAPWTCPKWMKVADIETKKAFDSWTDGHLNPDYRKDYAQYFVKFIAAMKQQGINIYAVCPQNEPLNKANCASLYMPWQEEAPFVAELASAFKKNGITTKIYLFDHNYNYDNVEDQQDYPVKVYNALGNEFEGSELVVGSAYHDYGGKNTELTDIHTQAPDKELIFSESSIGTWNDGRNLSKRLIEDMKNVTLGTVNQWGKAVLVWNLMLDMNMGPNLDGGCQTCFGAVDISMDYKTITRNSHYFVISHMASVVRPDAQRIGVQQRSLTKNGLVYSAFRNPDGTYAAVVLNSSDENITAVISDGQRHFRTVIPAQAVVSCRW